MSDLRAIRCLLLLAAVLFPSVLVHSQQGDEQASWAVPNYRFSHDAGIHYRPCDVTFDSAIHDVNEQAPDLCGVGNHFSYFSVIQPSTEGDYFGYDSKAFASEKYPANKGYRFIVETDAEHVWWFIGDQKLHPSFSTTTGPYVEATDPKEDTDEMPHPLGYFIHSQADVRFQAIHHEFDAAPVVENGGRSHENPDEGMFFHEIEFVPTSVGTARVYVTAISDTFFGREESFFINVVDVLNEDGEEELEVRFPELVDESPQSVADANVDHLFLPEGSRVGLTTKVTYESLITAAPYMNIDSFIATTSNGRATFEETSEGLILPLVYAGSPLVLAPWENHIQIEIETILGSLIQVSSISEQRTARVRAQVYIVRGDCRREAGFDPD